MLNYFYELVKILNYLYSYIAIAYENQIRSMIRAFQLLHMTRFARNHEELFRVKFRKTRTLSCIMTKAYNITKFAQ